jgi:hypothetical protein
VTKYANKIGIVASKLVSLQQVIESQPFFSNILTASELAYVTVTVEGLHATMRQTEAQSPSK